MSICMWLDKISLPWNPEGHGNKPQGGLIYVDLLEIVSSASLFLVAFPLPHSWWLPTGHWSLGIGSIAKRGLWRHCPLDHPHKQAQTWSEGLLTCQQATILSHIKRIVIVRGPPQVEVTGSICINALCELDSALSDNDSDQSVWG